MGENDQRLSAAREAYAQFTRYFAADKRWSLDSMNTLAGKIERADRLNLIAERIGFALWQLQELEGASAQYYVLLERASPGMGLAAGKELLDEALRKTFGKTVTRLQSSGKIRTEFMARFQRLLDERNWLVHNSRAGSRTAVHDEVACTNLIRRVDAIADEALALLKEVSKGAEAFLLTQGFSQQTVEQAAQRVRNPQ